MKAAPSRRDHLRAQLADLKMPGALEALDEILAGLDGGTLTAPAALDALLQAQIALRNHRRLDAAMRSSRLPAVKTLADFDFTVQPSIKREQLDSLHTLGFSESQLCWMVRVDLPFAPAPVFPGSGTGCPGTSSEGVFHTPLKLWGDWGEDTAVSEDGERYCEQDLADVRRCHSVSRTRLSH